jgi:hypothetical protein
VISKRRDAQGAGLRRRLCGGRDLQEREAGDTGAEQGELGQATHLNVSPTGLSCTNMDALFNN